LSSARSKVSGSVPRMGPRASRTRVLPVLSELLGEFIDNGGEIWLCGSCTKPRGIAEDRLVKGAKITGAAKVIEEVAAGAKTLTYT
jgi:uncharacterized protein